MRTESIKEKVVCYQSIRITDIICFNYFYAYTPSVYEANENVQKSRTHFRIAITNILISILMYGIYYNL